MLRWLHFHVRSSLWAYQSEFSRCRIIHLDWPWPGFLSAHALFQCQAMCQSDLEGRQVKIGQQVSNRVNV